MEGSLWVLLGKKIKRKKKNPLLSSLPKHWKGSYGPLQGCRKASEETLPAANRCRALWAESSFQQAGERPCLERRRRWQPRCMCGRGGGGQGQVSKAHSPDCLLLFPVPALSSWGHPHTSPQCLPMPPSVPCAPYIVQGSISGTLTCHKLIFTVSFCPPLLAK